MSLEAAQSLGEQTTPGNLGRDIASGQTTVRAGARVGWIHKLAAMRTGEDRVMVGLSPIHSPAVLLEKLCTSIPKVEIWAKVRDVEVFARNGIGLGSLQML